MKKIKSDYKEVEVDALEANIVFGFKNRNTQKRSTEKFDGFWLKTGEIVVDKFASYENFILAIYDKADINDSSITHALIEVKSSPGCHSPILANSDTKWSYTDTKTIKAEIKKIKAINKEKKALTELLKNTNPLPATTPTMKSSKIKKI